MRFERPKEWWLARARAEPEVTIGAGVEMSDRAIRDQQSSAEEPAISVPFGEFVHLLRRQQSLSIEQFAEVVNIDVSEARVLEDDPSYLPEPRTIFYVAQAFNLSQQELNEYAGLTAANDHDVVDGQLRYAARSESRSQLSADELALLNTIVAVLADRVENSRP